MKSGMFWTQRVIIQPLPVERELGFLQCGDIDAQADRIAVVGFQILDPQPAAVGVGKDLGVPVRVAKILHPGLHPGFGLAAIRPAASG